MGLAADDIVLDPIDLAIIARLGARL